MEIFALVGRVALEGAENVQRGLDEINKRTGGLADSLQHMGARVGSIGGKMTKWVTGPIGLASGALFGLVKTTANAGDEIQKMALRTGFSTESLSELRHAAELSGTSLDGIENAVRRMQRSIFDLERGTATQTEAFAALGLTIDDLQGLSPEEQFNKITMALADVDDASRRAALAQQIFGRQGTMLLPMLAEGSDGLAKMRQEAHELGLVFDQESADASAAFNDELTRLQGAFVGVVQELGKQLLPILTDDLIPVIKEDVIPLVRDFGDRIASLIEWFSNLDPKWKKIILAATGFAFAIGPIMSILGPIISMVGSLIGFLPVLGSAFAALTGPIGLVVAAIAGLITAGLLVVKNWDEIKAWFGRLIDGLRAKWETFKDRLINIWNSMKEALKMPLNAMIEIANRAIGALNKIKVKVPNWVPVYGGREFGLNIPQIPKLHEGGIFQAPTPGGEGLALLRDREAVLPPEHPLISDPSGLARMIGREVAASIVPALESAAGDGRPLEVHVHLDSRRMARSLYPALRAEADRLGDAIA